MLREGDQERSQSCPSPPAAELFPPQSPVLPISTTGNVCLNRQLCEVSMIVYV